VCYLMIRSVVYVPYSATCGDCVFEPDRIYTQALQAYFKRVFPPPSSPKHTPNGSPYISARGLQADTHAEYKVRFTTRDLLTPHLRMFQHYYASLTHVELMDDLTVKLTAEG